MRRLLPVVTLLLNGLVWNGPVDQTLRHVICIGRSRARRYSTSKDGLTGPLTQRNLENPSSHLKAARSMRFDSPNVLYQSSNFDYAVRAALVN